LINLRLVIPAKAGFHFTINRIIDFPLNPAFAGITVKTDLVRNSQALALVKSLIHLTSEVIFNIVL